MDRRPRARRGRPQGDWPVDSSGHCASSRRCARSSSPTRSRRPWPSSPRPGCRRPRAVRRHQSSRPIRAAPKKPDSAEDLAFLPVTELAALIRTRQVSSVELTKLYLDRLKQLRPAAALRRHAHRGAGAQAGGAGRPRDRRRPLSRAAARHPLGGQGPDRLSRLPDDLGRAAVQGPDDRREGDGRRAAGGGRRGARGQAVAGSAGDGRPLVRRHDAQPVGPAAAARAARRPARRRRRRRAWSASPSAARRWAASSRPARACGVTGLRPTFGRVSRHGCMTLSWSMDKIGPMARSRRGLRPGLRRHPRLRRPRRRRRRSPLRLAAAPRSAEL